MFKIGRRIGGSLPSKPVVVVTDGSGAILMRKERERRLLEMSNNDKHPEDKNTPPELPSKT